MSLSFVYQGSPAHIVFGEGSSNRVGEWVEKLGASRALVLTTPHQKADGEAMAAALGRLAVGTYDNATMHTPVDVTEEAVARVLALKADVVAALGGGSTTGLGKAIAYRIDLPQIVVPTTYAGSEVTPILGQTEGGEKTTLRSPKILPEVVIYDPDLTLGLPVGMSVTSGLNAIAHAAEALYAPMEPDHFRYGGRRHARHQGGAACHHRLGQGQAGPHQCTLRRLAVRHGTLPGRDVAAPQDLPHVGWQFRYAPCRNPCDHVAAHHRVQRGCRGKRAAAGCRYLGGTPGQALYDFAKSVGSPMALKDFGLKEADLDRAAEIATKNPYANPRPIDRASIRALLQDAWEGSRPPL